jgi:hypothetical protein
LKQDTSNSISETEQKIRKFDGPEQYNFIRRLTISLEIQIRDNYPSMDSNIPNGYPSRFVTINRHLRDDSNPELRRKIISGKITCYQLCTSKEEDLWSTKKKLEL